jgi:hypothetical protein
MEKQNFKNHSRIIPVYHVIGSFLIVAILIGAFVNLFDAINKDAGLLSAVLILSISIALVILFWYGRSFALKAQDRAIRSEESLRYFLLSHERIDSRLKIGQIIALRFAGDDEFIALAKRAIEENLSPKQIKMEIKNWRGDYYRV